MCVVCKLVGQGNGSITPTHTEAQGAPRARVAMAMVHACYSIMFMYLCKKGERDKKEENKASKERAERKRERRERKGKGRKRRAGEGREVGRGVLQKHQFYKSLSRSLSPPSPSAALSATAPRRRSFRAARWRFRRCFLAWSLSSRSASNAAAVAQSVATS